MSTTNPIAEIALHLSDGVVAALESASPEDNPFNGQYGGTDAITAPEYGAAWTQFAHSVANLYYEAKRTVGYAEFRASIASMLEVLPDAELLPDEVFKTTVSA